MQPVKLFPPRAQELKDDFTLDQELFSLADKYSPIYNVQDEDPTSQKFQCIICGKPTLCCCAGCKLVFYCSASHQQLHW